MAYPRQHRQAAQLIGLPSDRARKHRSDGPEADDALTIKPDHPMAARHAGSIIDWSVPMASIFMDKVQARAWWLENKHLLGRNSRPPKRPLDPPTMARIAKGVQRFVIEAQEPYFVSYAQQGGRSRSASDPLHTLCTSSKDQNQIVAAQMAKVSAFMAQHNTGVVGRDLREPLSTLTTRGTQQQLVAASMIQVGYTERKGQAPRCLDISKPLGTVVASSTKHAIVGAHMMPFFGTSVAHDMADPVGALTAGGGGKHSWSPASCTNTTAPPLAAN